MRPIKFRAWQKVTKIMFFNIEKGTGDTYNSNPPFADYLENKNMIIMQFTGLLDKNGKEIYDGDIVQTGQAKERGIASPFVGRIYWFDHEFQWWVTDDTKDSVDGIDYDITFLRSYQDVEIIGNIYEHPELIKDHNA